MLLAADFEIAVFPRNLRANSARRRDRLSGTFQPYLRK
jgi:hypothetical protein